MEKSDPLLYLRLTNMIPIDIPKQTGKSPRGLNPTRSLYDVIQAEQVTFRNIYGYTYICASYHN